MISIRPFLLALLACCFAATATAADPWLVVDGGEGPGKGKQVVLVSGDEEYRSEEGLTQLAKILAKHHGFSCTVLYAIDPSTGEISPNRGDNIPGLASLRRADMLEIATRFRNLPDGQNTFAPPCRRRSSEQQRRSDVASTSLISRKSSTVAFGTRASLFFTAAGSTSRTCSSTAGSLECFSLHWPCPNDPRADRSGSSAQKVFQNTPRPIVRGTLMNHT